MVAPLVGLGVGLAYGLGRRALANRRERDEAEQIEAERERYRQALEANFGAGQMGVGGMGPPTPGQAVLTPQQLAAVRLLQPELGWKEAVRMRAANVAQEQADATLEIQQNRNKLTREQLGLAERQFKSTKAADVAERARAQRILTDPDYAREQAIIDGKTEYYNAYADEVVQMAGSDAAREVTQSLEKRTNLLEDIAEVSRLSAQLGGQALREDTPEARRLGAITTRIWLTLKDEAELGAITGPDELYLLNQFPDARSWFEQAISNPVALLGAYAGTAEGVARSLGQELNATANWELDNGVRNRAIGQINVARSLRQIVEEEAAAPPAVDPEVQFRERMGNAVGNFNLFREAGNFADELKSLAMSMIR